MTTSFPGRPPKRPGGLHKNYFRDIKLLKRGPVDDEIDFSRAPAREEAEAMAA